jgi:hypothetical protein
MSVLSTRVNLCGALFGKLELRIKSILWEMLLTSSNPFDSSFEITSLNFDNNSLTFVAMLLPFFYELKIFGKMGKQHLAIFSSFKNSLVMHSVKATTTAIITLIVVVSFFHSSQAEKYSLLHHEQLSCQIPKAFPTTNGKHPLALHHTTLGNGNSQDGNLSRTTMK